MPNPRSVCSAAVLALAVAGSQPAAAASELPVVFVSIPPQKFVVEQLAGGLVRVEVMLPPGASPATYEPTPRQMAALNGATIYLQIGVPFEGPVLSKVATLMPDLDIVDCRQGITLVPMENGADGHAHGPLDPHFWLDPTAMKTVVRTTARALGDTITGAAGKLETTLPRLLAAIDETDGRITSIMRPLAGRDLVVFHPAYGYFTRRYGLVQIAIEAGGKAPTARQLAAIVDSRRGRDTAAIFVQPQFSQTAARRVADALGCELIVLDPLAESYLPNLELMADRIAAVLGT